MDTRLLDALPIPTAILRAGRVAYVNPALCATVGQEAARLVGRLQTDYIAPEDLERVLDRQRRRLRGQAAPVDYEAHLVLPSGDRIRCLLYAVADGEDIVVQIVDATLDAASTIRDLRERNEELAALNRLAETAATAPSLPAFFERGAEEVTRSLPCHGLAIWLLDEARGGLVLAHQVGVAEEAARSVPRMPVGGPGPGAVARDGIARILTNDDYPPEIRALVLQAGFSSHASVPLMVRARIVGVMNAAWREPLASSASLARLQAMAAPFGAAVEAQRLLAEARRRTAELARAQAQLVRQERLAALGELAAVVAHEVRNPLGVIFNSLGSLRRLLQPQGDAGMLLDIVGEEADRLNRIVGDLLDFARPATPTLRPEAVDRLLDDVVGAALGDNPQRIVLQREVEPGLPLVPMDSRLMRQAVLNVAVNAVQAMPHGGQLWVAARRCEEGVCIEIGDTGSGIPGEVRHRIFEPFFTTKASGTGLGLAVVRRIVEEHEGRIRVENRSGRGTVFTIQLPLAKPLT